MLMDKTCFKEPSESDEKLKAFLYFVQNQRFLTLLHL